MQYQGPKYSATQERSIGIGALGYHAYLQKHMLHGNQQRHVLRM